MKTRRLILTVFCSGILLGLLGACAADEQMGLCSGLGLCPADPDCKDNPDTCSDAVSHSTDSHSAGGGHSGPDDSSGQ